MSFFLVSRATSPVYTHRSIGFLQRHPMTDLRILHLGHPSPRKTAGQRPSRAPSPSRVGDPNLSIRSCPVTNTRRLGWQLTGSLYVVEGIGHQVSREPDLEENYVSVLKVVRVIRKVAVV